MSGTSGAGYVFRVCKSLFRLRPGRSESQRPAVRGAYLSDARYLGETASAQWSSHREGCGRFYTSFSLKLTGRWDLSTRLTNQPPSFHPLAPVFARGYGRECNHVARNRRMAGPSCASLPSHSRLGDPCFCSLLDALKKCPVLLG